jgi:hypothetical protein
MRRTALLATLLAWALVPSAQAASDPLGSGATKLVLDRGFARFLKADGIELAATAGATRHRSAYVLPIAGGALDPTLGKGEIDNEGSMVFENQRKRVPLRDIALKTDRSPLIAKVGGSQLKLATSARLSFKRVGFGSSFTAGKLRLTAKVATRLNKKMRPRLPFEAGQPLGTITARAEPKLTAIEAKGRATLVYDPAFLSRLQSRFVSLNPIFPAEHVGAAFTYPIAAGASLAPDGTEGELRTGGVTEMLQLGGGQVFWKELWFDMGQKQGTVEADVEPSPSLAGKLGRVGVLALTGGSVAADPGARTISLTAAQLTLTAEGAKQLNEAFCQREAPVFATGEAVGQLSFTAQAQ